MKILEAEKVQTVSSATNIRPQGASFESERLTLPHGTKSGSARLFSSSIDVMNIVGISFDGAAKVPLFCAKTQKYKETIGITPKIQIPALLFFDTAAGPSLIQKSIVPPLRRSCIHHRNVLLLRTPTKKSLELEGVMLPHVRVGDPEVPVRFGVENGLGVCILVETSLLNRSACGIFPFVQRVMPRNSKPVYISTRGRRNQ